MTEQAYSYSLYQSPLLPAVGQCSPGPSAAAVWKAFYSPAEFMGDARVQHEQQVAVGWVPHFVFYTEVRKSSWMPKDNLCWGFVSQSMCLYGFLHRCSIFLLISHMSSPAWKLLGLFAWLIMPAEHLQIKVFMNDSSAFKTIEKIYVHSEACLKPAEALTWAEKTGKEKIQQ